MEQSSEISTRGAGANRYRFGGKELETAGGAPHGVAARAYCVRGQMKNTFGMFIVDLLRMVLFGDTIQKAVDRLKSSK